MHQAGSNVALNQQCDSEELLHQRGKIDVGDIQAAHNTLCRQVVLRAGEVVDEAVPRGRGSERAGQQQQRADEEQQLDQAGVQPPSGMMAQGAEGHDLPPSDSPQADERNAGEQSERKKPWSGRSPPVTPQSENAQG